MLDDWERRGMRGGCPVFQRTLTFMNDAPSCTLAEVRDEIRRAARRICLCVAMCSWLLAVVFVFLGTQLVLWTGVALVVFPPLGFVGYFFVRSMRHAAEKDHREREAAAKAGSGPES